MACVGSVSSHPGPAFADAEMAAAGVGSPAPSLFPMLDRRERLQDSADEEDSEEEASLLQADDATATDDTEETEQKVEGEEEDTTKEEEQREGEGKRKE